jgi:hypothetical protein
MRNTGRMSGAEANLDHGRRGRRSVFRIPYSVFAAALRSARWFHALPFLFLLLSFVGSACDPVPVDDQRLDKRLFLPRGVIRGAVTYSGPRPCSQNGHIVGAAVVLVFAANNPPPPQGLANSAVNFSVVPGDVLFTNEVRSSGSDLFCPQDTTTVTLAAPYTISPLDAGQYTLAAFYDRTGRFLPTFKFRNLPEAGDVAGGYIDVADAEANATNPNYSPKFIPVTVGVAQTVNGATTLVIPDQGYVADNIPVTLGLSLPYQRPTFYVEGADQPGGTTPTPMNPNGDPSFAPIVTMTQDHQVLAPPANATNLSAVTALQASFAQMKLHWGVPQAELMDATRADGPFGLPLQPAPPQPGLLAWSMGTTLPENPLLEAMWPLVVLAKLEDDPTHALDPQSLTPQGSSKAPIVVLEAITLNGDGLLTTTNGIPPKSPTATGALKEHTTILLRPSVLCLNPSVPNAGGVLVTPHLTGKSADPTESGEKPLFDPMAVIKGNPLVKSVKQGCLPAGRYEINAVYPTGQAWTVPNEAGSCATPEGLLVRTPGTGSCNKKPRPVLYSQGTRAVLEIIPPTTPEGEATCTMFPVPAECLPQ